MTYVLGDRCAQTSDIEITESDATRHRHTSFLHVNQFYGVDNQHPPPPECPPPLDFNGHIYNFYWIKYFWNCCQLYSKYFIQFDILRLCNEIKLFIDIEQ